MSLAKKLILRRSLCSLALLFTLLFETRPAYALCDVCVKSAVTLVNGSLLVLLKKTDDLGNAIGALVTSNTKHFLDLQTTNKSGFETLVYEGHARVSKQSSFDLKRDINDAFGTIAIDHCFEVEESAGKTDNANAQNRQVLLKTKLFSKEINSNTRSPALRRRIMEEYVPEGLDLGRYFSSQQTLNEAELAHVPVLTHVLSQSVVFPAAPAKANEKENDRTRYYRELKRERDAHGSIIEDTLARSILSNAPVLDAGDYVRRVLEGAGIDPDEYVHGEKTSESALIKAIGHSSFGNQAAIRNSAYSGTELMRILIGEVGKSNYILSKQYEAMKDLRYIATLGFAKQVEGFYETRLEQAFVRLN